MAAVYDVKVAGDVVLSSFPNCVNRPIQVTAENLAVWKTERGIGLGATVDDVRRVYGPPSREEKVEGDGFRWVIEGDYNYKEARFSNIKRPEIGDKVLVYDAPQDLKSAEFGTRHGRAVWISVSKNE
jgi:hypothetical protein